MKVLSSEKQLAAVTRCIHAVAVGAMLVLSILLRFTFGVICSACAVVFYFTWLNMDILTGRDEEEQKTKCRRHGPLLIIPSLGMVGAGIFFLFLRNIPAISVYSIGIIVAAGLLMASMTAHFIINIKRKSPAARFLRLTCLVCVGAPISTAMVILLNGSDPESVPALGCMTAVLFGALGLGAAMYMIMVSTWGYAGTRESIRQTKAWFDEKRKYLPHFMAVKDIFLVLAKSVLALISTSFFMLANALYSVGMGIGRRLAYRMPTQTRQEQVKTYRRVGIIISSSSACYVLYSIRLLFGESSASYPMVIALIIAMYTFVEFGINIREAIRLRKSHALEAKALRALSFASTLLCFVLTQTAIMSFAAEGDNRATNALSGIIFGGLATLVGVYVMVNSVRYMRHSEWATVDE